MLFSMISFRDGVRTKCRELVLSKALSQAVSPSSPRLGTDNVSIMLQANGGMVEWCSGYHSCLTHYPCILQGFVGAQAVVGSIPASIKSIF